MKNLRTRIVLLLVTLIVAVVAAITITITMTYAFSTPGEQDCPQWPLLGSRQNSPLGQLE
jgi:hypothetical protein